MTSLLRQVVQEALDKARLGRTCVIVAHRLSTVRTADTIAVIKAGKLVEQGTNVHLVHTSAMRENRVVG